MAARERDRSSKVNETTPEGNTIQRYRREKRRSHERIEWEREEDKQKKNWEAVEVVAHTYTWCRTCYLSLSLSLSLKGEMEGRQIDTHTATASVFSSIRWVCFCIQVNSFFFCCWSLSCPVPRLCLSPFPFAFIPDSIPVWSFMFRLLLYSCRDR